MKGDWNDYCINERTVGNTTQLEYVELLSLVGRDRSVGGGELLVALSVRCLSCPHFQNPWRM